MGGMAIHGTAKHIEMALIELEYLSADALFDAKGHLTAEDSRRMASYYQAACKALEVCLEVIQQTKILVA
jgi:hypothetical protein